MAKEIERYNSFKQQKEPKGAGVLNFDEVEVISVEFKKSKVIDLAMNPDDMSSLHDAYQLMNEISVTNRYVICFNFFEGVSPAPSFDVVDPNLVTQVHCSTHTQQGCGPACRQGHRLAHIQGRRPAHTWGCRLARSQVCRPAHTQGCCPGD